MKKQLLSVLLSVMLIVLMAGCGTTEGKEAEKVKTDISNEMEQAADEMEQAITETTDELEGLQLTLEELKEYNGKNGNKAYVAVDGVIYDVTDMLEWAGGEHNGYEAGIDLTEEIEKAPHGKTILKMLEVVGSVS